MIGVYKYDVGDFKSTMSLSDKGKLPKFLEIDIVTHPIIQYLSIEVIDSHVFIWALAHGDKPQILTKLGIYPTGYQIAKSNLIHVGTYHEKQWNHVWHVFEIKA